MVHILFWIIFGGLVGLVAAILKGDMQLTPRSYLMTVTGAIGGLLGGLSGLLINPDIESYDSQAGGLLFAVIGAITLVLIIPFIYSKYITPYLTADDDRQSATRDAKRQ
jgi:uncharacterized membrane protein YeaQ/YmgE (transglycosylase-associated protein family)